MPTIVRCSLGVYIAMSSNVLINCSDMMAVAGVKFIFVIQIKNIIIGIIIKI